MRGEKVHSMRSMDDLRQRMGANRRIYALMHPRMEETVLVFIQVALKQRISDSIQFILNERTSEAANEDSAPKCAIFYSISSTQPGRLITINSLMTKDCLGSIWAV